MFNLNANKSGLICFTQDCECKLNLQQCLIVSVCLYIFLFFPCSSVSAIIPNFGLLWFLVLLLNDLAYSHVYVAVKYFNTQSASCHINFLY